MIKTSESPAAAAGLHCHLSSADKTCKKVRTTNTFLNLAKIMVTISISNLFFFFFPCDTSCFSQHLCTRTPIELRFFLLCTLKKPKCFKIRLAGMLHVSKKQTWHDLSELMQHTNKQTIASPDIQYSMFEQQFYPITFRKCKRIGH